MAAGVVGRAWRVVAAIVLACGAPCVLHADDKRADSSSSSSSSTPADDSDLFEYLGSVGSDDAAWLSYLARTDPNKVARAPRAPPASGGKQDD